MLNAEELQKGLQQFTGTEQYFKHPFGLNYTDGIYYLSRNTNAYWLVDAIASHQQKLRQNQRLAEFQLWLFVVGNAHEFIKPKLAAVLTCWEDTPSADTKPVVRQDIHYTDFPLQEITLYVQESVLMLPGEN